jgi:copper(I)-binding protein
MVASALAVLGCRASRGGSAASATMALSHAVIPASPSPTDASAFMVVTNRGAAPDSLTGVGSPDAEMVMLHQMVENRMEMIEGVAVPAGARVRLAPGGYHLMLHGLARPAAVGDTLTLQLHFVRAGELTVRAPVLRYTDAVEEVAPH